MSTVFKIEKNQTVFRKTTNVFCELILVHILLEKLQFLVVEDGQKYLNVFVIFSHSGRQSNNTTG